MSLALRFLPRGIFAAGVLCALSGCLLNRSVAAEKFAQPAAAGVLSLSQAEAIAITNQPRILAARLRAQSAAQRVRQARSGLLPNVNFNATGVRVADTDTATAAGALTTSSLSDRFAYGANIVQLVTDFGRTSALIASSRASEQAQQDEATLTTADVRLGVREAYFQVLGAEAVLRAAREAQQNRALISRQVGALAASQLRSTLASISLACWRVRQNSPSFARRAP